MELKTVIDYLWFINENYGDNIKVQVIENNTVVSEYNGKDSIDEEYNNKEVVRACYTKSTDTYKLFI
jgi:hypothetical protein